jgi:dTDP-4-dehydrorhamnose 3,5-epimerase-like enzyme
MHTDFITNKLITFIRGTFWFYVINLDPSAKDFGTLQQYRPIYDDNIQLTQAWVPASYANGHYCHYGFPCIIEYKWDQYWSENQYTISYKDPHIDILRYHTSPILSDRDENGSSFLEVAEKFTKKQWETKE